MNAHAMTFAQAQSIYDAMLPPEDGRADAMEREAERIEADADKVRELVEDNIDAIDSPICADVWPVELLITLRDTRMLFSALCNGRTLEEAMRLAPGIDAFRVLLRLSDRADEWIAKLIDQAASEAADTMEDDA